MAVFALPLPLGHVDGNPLVLDERAAASARGLSGTGAGQPRRVRCPSMQAGAAPIVHWRPASTRAGDAFLWAGMLSRLLALGAPVVLFQHGESAESAGHRTASDEGRPAEATALPADVTSGPVRADPVRESAAFSGWLRRHAAAWAASCRAVIVIEPDIARRNDARMAAMRRFGTGARVIAVSRESVARQLAEVLLKEGRAAGSRSQSISRGA